MHALYLFVFRSVDPGKNSIKPVRRVDGKLNAFEGEPIRIFERYSRMPRNKHLSIVIRLCVCDCFGPVSCQVAEKL